MGNQTTGDGRTGNSAGAPAADPTRDGTSGTKRERTSTSSFGSRGRNGHDASAFYARFGDQTGTSQTGHGAADVRRPVQVDRIVTGDARTVLADDQLTVDDSVALVVTSPPYFAGKDYETSDQGGVPGTFDDYAAMLDTVLGHCAAKLEPGGRICVNVANLGRRPYRPLSHLVADILTRQGLLLRGEIIWRKARGAGSSASWGTFRDARNPVLRDVTERVVVACKGGFSRAGTATERQAAGLPHRSSISAADFMAATVDVWDIAAESATRVGHPAPFPVDLARTLIELYSFEGDVILDPFLGSGTTAVAARRSGRRYLGIEFDAGYAQAARDRVSTETRQQHRDPVEITGDALAHIGGTVENRRGTLTWTAPDGRTRLVHVLDGRVALHRLGARETLDRLIATAALDNRRTHGLVLDTANRELLQLARRAAGAGIFAFAAALDDPAGNGPGTDPVAALAGRIRAALDPARTR